MNIILISRVFFRNHVLWWFIEIVWKSGGDASKEQKGKGI